MAWHARFARDSMLLAATLAVVPLALPLSVTWGSVGEPALASPPPVLLLHPAALPAAANLPGTHMVAWGDTLWEISREAGVSIMTLAAANHMCEDDPLIPGRILALPAPGSPEPKISTTEECARVIAQGADIGWPAFGRITSRFGWRIHPIFRTREFHTGVDIASGWGAPVRAAKGGVVHFVGWMIGYGRLIVVDHGNGLQTFYAHLSTALVHVGARVEQGELIGRVGSTGWSTGPHLFFEVRRYGVPLDPLRLMH
jgi:hypothetical protein